MPTISHRFYHTNISVADAVRKLVQALTVTQPKVGRMWELINFYDPEPANANYTGPLVFVLKKALLAEDPVFMFAKIVYKDKKLFVCMSPTYTYATDFNDTVAMSSFATNLLEPETGGDIRTLDSAGAEVAPANVVIPMMILPEAFDPAVDRLAKVWIIRKLGPLFDEVDPRKNTDIYAWMTVCTGEIGSTMVDTFGYYQHIGFGCAGEQFTPDTLLNNGVGLFCTAGSFASSTSTVELTSKRLFPGGGVSAGDNNATLVCAGDHDTYRTWFYANTAYGQARSPFDDDNIEGGRNVGFDFTELCKFSPYSGVRILTPSYIYGMYDNLFRIICRLPVFYTSLEGLYAGDIISQEVESVLRSYAIFPLWHYRCIGDAEAKRGVAILVPADEVVD